MCHDLFTDASIQVEVKDRSKVWDSEPDVHGSGTGFDPVLESFQLSHMPILHSDHAWTTEPPIDTT